ncbi:Ppx/GppA phosphatase family-domain-containing protein [Mariannaea sp. PMI_226]|nr:Ppx/GppA phosphatase family-domain-containing protein [Mariannaea sp. PMI_226]
MTKMEEFSDFEEISAISESEDQECDETEPLESMIDNLAFPQTIDSFPAEVGGGGGGWRPPWLGHGDKLVGVVDMGSNGIRFSISDLTPPLARIMPTILMYRVGISLYDCQYDSDTGEQVPIPDDVISSICSALSRFVHVCDDFGTPKDRVHVLATEATRAAINSDQFLKTIKEKTGLTVELLPKEEEGRIGALGIASGFSRMAGLVMDLGGGSTQITWMLSQGSDIRISPHGSFSFPYGAAALTKKLRDLKHGKSKEEAEVAVNVFRGEMIEQFRDAYHRLQIPEELINSAKQNGGFQIYLSGGGFRGWGYLLLYLNQVHGKHYPISIINGYTAGKEQFEDTETLKDVAKAAKNVFRVSDRRRSQVPAVAFLVNVLAEAIPHGIKEAHFCQGGVREGYLFKQLPASVRRQAPLEVATGPFARGARRAIQRMLRNAIPNPTKDESKHFPEAFGDHVIDSFANSMYAHMFMSLETASAAALSSTSVGILSTVHGVSHQDRARLALMLEARYRGELPPRELDFRTALQRLITPEEVWWASYLGRVGYLITTLYPTGKIDKSKARIVFSAQWSWTMGKKKDKEGIIFTISVQKTANDPGRTKETLEQFSKEVEKAGKKKNWVGKPEPWGLKVKVKVIEEGILGEPENE